MVDKSPSLDNLQNSLDEIKQKIGDSSTPIILYLVGHGIEEVFDFYTESDALSSSKLREMLKPFHDNLMLIVIGSCYSGSFITVDYVDDTISDQNRIIITACHDDEERESLWGLGGWFHSSDRFWGNLNKGLNVKDAFIRDTWPGDRKHLWLDDNGDSIGHAPHNLGNDGVLASATKIGVPGTDDLELTSWYSVWIHSAGELRVYDSQNRVTGLVDGEVKEEIPNSVYDEENEIIAVFSPSDTYRYQIVGIDEGTYGLDVASIEDGEATTFNATNIPIQNESIHQYVILNWTSLERGEYVVQVWIDQDGDGDFEIKIMSDSEFTPHDIAVTNVTPSKNVVGEGYLISINVTIMNTGIYTETFNITAYANTTIIDTKEITLTNGNSTILGFTWNTTGLTEYQNYTISAYVHPVPGEVDTDDNTFTDGIVLVVHVGDVNGDGKVRIDDILTIAQAFGSEPGHPRWDPNCDINCDDKVRVDDILVTALEFGWTKP